MTEKEKKKVLATISQLENMKRQNPLQFVKTMKRACEDPRVKSKLEGKELNLNNADEMFKALKEVLLSQE